MRDQNDPSRVYTLVLFESEENARARERDAHRQEGLTAARATMAEMFDGPPEFVDLTVVNDCEPLPSACADSAHIMHTAVTSRTARYRSGNWPRTPAERERLGAPSLRICCLPRARRIYGDGASCGEWYEA